MISLKVIFRVIDRKRDLNNNFFTEIEKKHSNNNESKKI